MLLARKRVRRYLSIDPEIEIIGECANGNEAAVMIPQLKPDLVFFDVQMPGMSGFEVLEKLSDTKMPVIIFVTAYDEFAIQAFEVNALDYLLKPLNRERFYKALNRAKSLINLQKAGNNNSNLQNLLENIKNNFPKRLTIKANGKVIFLLIDEIDWIQSAGNYLEIQAGKESYLTRETLNQIEQKLDPEKFIRIHRSVLVNLDRIKEMHPLFSGDQEIILRNGKRFTMTRNYRNNLRRT